MCDKKAQDGLTGKIRYDAAPCEPAERCGFPQPRLEMLKSGDTVVVGVSGGADSMTLLHILCTERGKLGIKLCAAHINHCLRGEEADRDERYVRQMCEKWSVELRVLRLDVKNEAQSKGQTVEEAGRAVRYRFFDSIASESGAWVATAHTLSDSIETVLINFARGTGLKGMCGIPAQRGRLIRPLIDFTRAQTEEYCRLNAIEYVNDSTNFSREITRNRVRLDAVPVLYSVNPAFDRAAKRALESLGRDESALSRLTDEWLARSRVGKDAYDLKILAECPEDTVRRVIAKAALLACSSAQEAANVESVLAILRAGDGKVEIKGGSFARISGGKLVFESGAARNETFSPAVLSQGIFENSAFRLKISLAEGEELKNFKNINKHISNNALDCDKIIGTAILRPREPGESLRPVGRGISKTLKKLFSEAAVPQELRALVPVAADDEGPIWVCGFGADERCRVTDSTKRAVVIDVMPKDGRTQEE